MHPRRTIQCLVHYRPADRWREVKAGALAANHAASPKLAKLCAEAFCNTGPLN